MSDMAVDLFWGIFAANVATGGVAFVLGSVKGFVAHRALAKHVVILNTAIEELKKQRVERNPNLQ